MQDKSSGRRGFPARLDITLRRAGRSKTALAKELGIAKSTITRWNSGALPRAEVLAKIADMGDVRREWLASGIEPMEIAAAAKHHDKGMAAYVEGKTDADMLEELLSAMPNETLRAQLDKYMHRAETDKEDRRALSMARLLLSEINLRAAAAPK